MQKKCLLFMVTFSCVVQVFGMGDQQNIQEDRFAQLPASLRKFRENPNNAIYADVMVEGIEAIDKAKQEKIKLIEKERIERRRKVSSNQSSWGKEEEGTEAYIGFKKIDDELNKDIETHKKLAQIYTNCTSDMHNELSKTAHVE